MTVKLEKLRKRLYPKLLDALVQHPEAIDAYEKGARAWIARKNDNADGFDHFYFLIYGRETPKHVKYWIEQIYDACSQELFCLIEAFRGSTKSTTCTAFTCFRVGHNPEKSNLVIGSGDDDAKEVVKNAADIIENNPGWKLVFPHIVPDPTKSWGADSGYEVKDTNRKYDEWRQIRQREGRAPTLKGVGYKSQYLPGPHPTGVLMVDDIHNEENTSSDRELRKVKKIYTDTIVPTIEPETWHFLIGTPWTYHDVIAHAKTIGKYRHIKTPAYTDGKPTWPEKWDEKKLLDRLDVVKQIGFARMYHLDLSKTMGIILEKKWLHYWPHQNIKEDWPRYMGIDYTSTADPRKEAGDHFALVVGAIIPGGRGAVIEDGVYDKMSQAEAEDTVLAWTGRYPTLVLVGVEAVFSGNEFYNMLLNNAELRGNGVVPHPCRPRKSKGYRFEKLLAPMFQRSRIYLSDAESEFISAFVDEWLNWQGDALESAYNNDALDAVFNLAEVAQAFIAPLPPSARKTTNPLFKNREGKKRNPFAALGRR